MKEVSKKFWNILIRYLILVIIAIPNFWIFYLVFTPLTAYPVYFLLNLFYDASLIGSNVILLNFELPIELIEACIAGSAYYLLTILNLATPNIKLKKRINMLLLAFVAFLVLNIIRIVALSMVAFSGSTLFDITHQLFWYIFSIVFVIGIWFAEVKMFKIKEIPFYSDIKFLYKTSKLR
jgi:exosortase/archaeosortase family protein